MRLPQKSLLSRYHPTKRINEQIRIGEYVFRVDAFDDGAFENPGNTGLVGQACNIGTNEGGPVDPEERYFPRGLDKKDKTDGVIVENIVCIDIVENDNTLTRTFGAMISVLLVLHNRLRIPYLFQERKNEIKKLWMQYFLIFQQRETRYN